MPAMMRVLVLKPSSRRTHFAEGGRPLGPVLDQKHRLQTLFFPEGTAFDGSRFNRTALTAPFFSYLEAKNLNAEVVVSPEGIEPSTNRLRERRPDSAIVCTVVFVGYFRPFASAACCFVR